MRAPCIVLASRAVPPVTADETIADAELGARLIDKSVRTLIALASKAGGDGAGAILKPGVDAAADAAQDCCDVLCGIARGLSDIDPDKEG